MTDLEAEALELCNDLDLRKRGEKGRSGFKVFGTGEVFKKVPIRKIDEKESSFFFFFFFFFFI